MKNDICIGNTTILENHTTIFMGAFDLHKFENDEDIQ